MPSQVPHSVRFPDYGIPYKVIGRRSWAAYILSYAAFIARVRPPGSFSLEDYRSFRAGEVRRDYWNASTKKLVSLGYLMALSDGMFQITAKGYDANIRIAKRNAASRYANDDD